MRRRQLLSLATAVLAGCGSGLRSQAMAGADGTLRQIAFGSCIDQTRPQPIWDAVLADRPDLFIFAGDNVYSSQQPWSAARLAQAYELQGRVPGFARLRATVPHLAIWDDHDYGINDGGAEFAHKHASKAAFLKFWGVAQADPRFARDGLYHEQIAGPPGRRVQVIVLDGRWFRSPLKPSDDRGKPGKERYLPDADPAKTLLGEAQWRWLEEQLRKPADLRLLVSAIQVVADGHGWECWGNLPLERSRLFRLIADTQAQGILFLSGDRHTGSLYRETAGTPYPFYEITSSGITHAWAQAAEAGPNRLGDLVTELHYATVGIDWEAHSVRLSLKGVDGATRRSQLIRFNELRSSP